MCRGFAEARDSLLALYRSRFSQQIEVVCSEETLAACD